MIEDPLTRAQKLPPLRLGAAEPAKPAPAPDPKIAEALADRLALEAALSAMREENEQLKAEIVQLQKERTSLADKLGQTRLELENARRKECYPPILPAPPPDIFQPYSTVPPLQQQTCITQNVRPHPGQVGQINTAGGLSLHDMMMTAPRPSIADALRPGMTKAFGAWQATPPSWICE